MGEKRSNPAGAVISVAAALVLGIVLWGVLQGHIVQQNSSASQWTAFEGEPLLANYDGWFYLRMARDLENGKYGRVDPLRGEPRPEPAPLLSRMTVWFSDISGLPLRTSAFFLPAVLALFMLPLYILWARALGAPNAALPAILAATLSMYWFRRASVGWYDTDVLNLFFSTLLPLIACGFTFGKGVMRMVWLGVFCLVLFVFDLWWTRFGLLMGLASLGPYALTVFCKSSKTERVLKLLIPIMGAGVVVLLFTGGYESLPGEVSRVFAMLKEHVWLVLGKSGSVLGRGPEVHELSGVNFRDVMIHLAGSYVAFGIGAVGFLVLCVMRPKQGVFLLAVLVPGLFAVTADRFALWLVPPFALGFGFLFCLGADALSRTILPQKGAGVACFLAASLVLIPGARACWEFPQFPAPNADVASFLAGADTLTPRDARLWNWWDEGYALQYLGKRRTFIDGGLTSAKRYFLSCAPLAMTDPGKARLWIRYFSKHGPAGLHRVAAWAGGEQQAYAVLSEVFSHPDRAERILKMHGVENTSRWKKTLFPEVEAYLYLPRGTIMHLDAIMHAERSYFDPAHEKADHFQYGPLDRIRISGDGVVALDEPVRLWTLTTLTPSGLSRKKFDRNAGRHGFVSEKENLFFMMDSAGMQTLSARLMIGTPAGIPGFRPIAYNPFGGGVWKVE